MRKKCPFIDFPEELFYSQILTRLPLRESVRFSSVSRKWYRSWTRLSHLSFPLEFYDSIADDDSDQGTLQNTTVRIINKVITMQCAKVEVFEIFKCEWLQPNLHDWTLCISLKDVKRIHFECSNMSSALEVPASLYSCETITSLSLKNFKLTKVPALSCGFSQLVTLCLEHVELCKEALELLVGSCNRLHSLKVSHCKWPTNWIINSSSLKSLSLDDLDSLFSLEANSSSLETIKVTNCPDLKNLTVYLPQCVHLQTDCQLLQKFLPVSSLRKITFCMSSSSYFSHIKLMQGFPELEELWIDAPFCTDFSIPIPFVHLSLGKLQTLILNIHAREDGYSRYAALLSFIVAGARLLKTIRVGMGECLENSKLHAFDGIQLVNYLLHLQIRYSRTIIQVSRGRITPEAFNSI